MPRSSTSASRTPGGTGPAGRWPIAGFRWPRVEELETSPDVALAWTLRASPHYYRRAELFDVMAATSPLSDRDAAKRIIGADKPLKAAGISSRDSLVEVASQLRTVVSKPLAKGEVSTRLTPRARRALSAQLCALRSRPCLGDALPDQRPVRRARAGAGHLAAGAAPHSELATTLARPGGGPARRARAPAAHPQLPALPRPGDAAGRGRVPGLSGGRDQGPLARRRGRGHGRRPAAVVAGRIGARWRSTRRCCGCSAATTCCCRAGTAG